MPSQNQLQLIGSIETPQIPEKVKFLISSSDGVEIDSVMAPIEKLNSGSLNFLANSYRRELFEKANVKDPIDIFVELAATGGCYQVGTHKEYKRGYEAAQKYILTNIKKVLQLNHINNENNNS